MSSDLWVDSNFFFWHKITYFKIINSSSAWFLSFILFAYFICFLWETSQTDPFPKQLPHKLPPGFHIPSLHPCPYLRHHLFEAMIFMWMYNFCTFPEGRCLNHLLVVRVVKTCFCSKRYFPLHLLQNRIQMKTRSKHSPGHSPLVVKHT